ncbi:STAS domain-containing protein [Mycolicibacterium sp. Dal123E01]|uniref:STAS domain-containing protein n=1 Tax=Mycolicibacterium sp. Dal123E01 TaxID=3457578 RepID=UPI00403E9B9C
MSSSISCSRTGPAGPKSIDLDVTVRNRMQLFAERHNDTDVRITAVGNVDMSTAHHFSAHVFQSAGNCRRLSLDMTQVTFFDCAGFSALCYIDERCRQDDIKWVIHPAHYVSRVVSICDPAKGLPLVSAGQATASL